MKLPQRLRQRRICLCQQHIIGVHKQQHWQYEWRQPPGQLCRALRRNSPRAGRIQHKTHRVSANGHGIVHVLGPREAAHFDACTEIGQIFNWHFFIVASPLFCTSRDAPNK